MTAVLLLGAGYPLLQQLFPPVPLIEQVQNTPLPHHRRADVLPGGGVPGAMASRARFSSVSQPGHLFRNCCRDQSFDYFGGQTPYYL
jgi:hypothetical protein